MSLLPTTVDGRVRALAWLSLITEFIIVGTGGAVRLTESGLGCTTWPKCSADSLIPTPELGIHGLIEFGNRMMTGIVGIVAVLMLIALWRLRRSRPGLFGLAAGLVLAVIAQAVVGGVVVLTGLNPAIVGFHFIASIVMVCLSTLLVTQSYRRAGRHSILTPRAYFAGTIAAAALLGLTMVIGVVTTASGPNSGDPSAGRTGFDVSLLEHLHAWPAYATFAVVLAVALIGSLGRLRSGGWAVVTLALVLAQIGIGLIQANTGLPPAVVGAHLMVAALVTMTMTMTIVSQLATVNAEPDLERDERIEGDGEEEHGQIGDRAVEQPHR